MTPFRKHCCYSISAPVLRLLRSFSDETHVSEQEISNVASDWLPANQKPCQIILVNYHWFQLWFFSVTQAPGFLNIPKLSQMNLIKFDGMFILYYLGILPLHEMNKGCELLETSLTVGQHCSCQCPGAKASITGMVLYSRLSIWIFYVHSFFGSCQWPEYIPVSNWSRVHHEPSLTPG